MKIEDIAARVHAMPAIVSASEPDLKPQPDAGGEPIDLFMERTFRPDGLDGMTRFQAVSRAAGHFAKLVADGRMTPDEAALALVDWKRRKIEGEYSDAKALRTLADFIRNDAKRGASNGPPSIDAWADAMVTENCGEWRYIEAFGGWHYFNGFVWRPDKSNEALDLARRTVRKMAEPFKGESREYWKLTSAGTVAGVERLARTDRRVAGFAEEFDADPYLLNTPGGVVDLRTGETRAARRDDYFTRVAGATPNAGGCPRYLEFQRRIMDGDGELIRYLQMWFGYCLTGLARENVVSFWYGSGANGKSVNLGVLAGICGDYATPFPSNVLMASKHERHPEEVARLRGIRCAITSEVDQHARFDEAKFKLLSGGDKLTGRFMRRDTFEFEPQFSITIAGNHKPRISNVDEAMRRRLHLVPYVVTIPEGQRDKALPEKLRAEYGGILAWAIEGAVEYLRQGRLPAPARIVAATGEWFDSEDRVQQFLDASCALGPGERDTKANVYRGYQLWAMGNGERFVLTQRELNDALARKGFPECRIGEGRHKGLIGLRARLPFEA